MLLNIARQMDEADRLNALKGFEVRIELDETAAAIELIELDYVAPLPKGYVGKKAEAHYRTGEPKRRTLTIPAQPMRLFLSLNTPCGLVELRRRSLEYHAMAQIEAVPDSDKGPRAWWLAALNHAVTESMSTRGPIVPERTAEPRRSRPRARQPSRRAVAPSRAGLPSHQRPEPPRSRHRTARCQKHRLAARAGATGPATAVGLRRRARMATGGRSGHQQNQRLAIATGTRPVVGAPAPGGEGAPTYVPSPQEETTRPKEKAMEKTPYTIRIGTRAGGILDTQSADVDEGSTTYAQLLKDVPEIGKAIVGDGDIITIERAEEE